MCAPEVSLENRAPIDQANCPKPQLMYNHAEIEHMENTRSEIGMEKPTPLTQTQSVGAMTISPELFEKLYLTPKTEIPGDFRKRFANPTPMGFVGFVISSFTFAIIVMGWGGADGLSGVAGVFFFTGPFLLGLTTIFEWIMGNFFSMMVCGLFCVFWLSFGVLQLPSLGLAAAYSANGDPAEGAASVAYNAAMAIHLLVWAFALLTFIFFALRTNIVVVSILAFGVAAASTLSSAYWMVSKHNYETAERLQKTGGALFFVLAALGWYMTIAMGAVEMGYKINLPVGDLTHYWDRNDVEQGKR